MTRTAGAPIGCQRPSRFWGLGCPKIYHEVEDTLAGPARHTACDQASAFNYPIICAGARESVFWRDGA
ncbi:hypothetical protein [Thiolapillus sp.]|uniref:hypothetical protein n=1 Tax=Thiolapillus sp. TaxID=2017437 RepID=UPI00263AA873|nr:hypothetical protein [Thiolapillus sp.]